MELFFRKNRDPVFRSKSITGFSGERFSIAIMIAIAVSKSPIDFQM
jgi:hypothetical protein